MPSLHYMLLAGVPRTGIPEHHSSAYRSLQSYNYQIRPLLKQLIPLGGVALLHWYRAFVAAFPAQTSIAHWESLTRRAIPIQVLPQYSHSSDETQMWVIAAEWQWLQIKHQTRYLNGHREAWAVASLHVYLLQVQQTALVVSIFIWHSVCPWGRVNSFWVQVFQSRPHRSSSWIPGKWGFKFAVEPLEAVFLKLISFLPSPKPSAWSSHEMMQSWGKLGKKNRRTGRDSWEHEVWF